MNHQWTQNQRNEVYRMAKKGIPYREIAEKYGVTEGAVAGQVYQYKAEKKSNKQSLLRKKVNQLRKTGQAIDLSTVSVKKVDGSWTETQRNQAFSLWKKGAKYDQIAELFGVTKGAVAGQIHQARYAKTSSAEKSVTRTTRIGRPKKQVSDYIKDARLALSSTLEKLPKQTPSLSPTIQVSVSFPSDIYQSMLADCETLGITTSEWVLRKVAFSNRMKKATNVSEVIPQIMNQVLSPETISTVQKAMKESVVLQNAIQENGVQS